MNWMLRVLRATILMLLPAAACLAQTQSDAGYALPWNMLKPMKFQRPYQSIITNLSAPIPGSGSCTSHDTTFPIILPFDIDFLGSHYGRGSVARVGVGGFLVFNPAVFNGAPPYVLAPDMWYTDVVFPFWSDLMTTGTLGEGIFSKWSVDNTTNDSSMVIEWSVRTMSPPICSGRFQLRMTKHDNWYTLGYQHTDFEFEYDQSSPISRACPPGHYGAQVGAKRFGQDIGPPGPFGPGADDGKFLLFTQTGAITPYSAAITRLPTRERWMTMQAAMVNNVPDWYAEYASPYSSFFFYGYPDSGCRMKPIDADVACLKPPPGYSLNTSGNVYPAGHKPITHITVENVGHTLLDTVFVTVGVVNGGGGATDTSITLTGMTPQMIDTLAITLPVTAAGGYRARAIAYTRTDENRWNDTAVWTFFLTPTIDVLPVGIASPELNDQLLAPRYLTGTPIPIQAFFRSAGRARPQRINGWYKVRDDEGEVVASGTDSLSGASVQLGADVRRTMGSFTPTHPGRYSVVVVYSSPEDSLRGDDTLKGVPVRDWVSHGAASDARGVCPIFFEVFNAYDLAVGGIDFPHAPYAGDTVKGTTPLLATYVNNGGSRSSRVDARMRIADPTGRIVVDRTATLDPIDGGRRTRTRSFGTFTPAGSGTYTVTATFAEATRDSVSANDTARWTFVVVTPPRGRAKPAVAERGVAERGMAADAALIPNPASDRVALRMERTIAGTTRVTLYDPVGRELWSRSWETNGALSSLPIPIDGLASGLYRVRVEAPDGTIRILPLALRK